MFITELEIQNIRSLSQSELKFSKNINLLIGGNNSGKTTILKSIITCFQGIYLDSSDVRINQVASSIRLRFDGDDLDRMKDSAGQVIKFGINPNDFDKEILVSFSKTSGVSKTIKRRPDAH